MRAFADKYIIERILGSGGMATVYAARHRNGDRVALKVLHRDLALSPEARARFLREGYIANSVVHDGVVRVLDDGVLPDGTAYLVMDLLTGASVGRHLARLKRLPADDVLAIAQETLIVLVAAHEKGIVHRDIKPDNLFITSDGGLRVLDFGIARHILLEASATLPGVIVGTPAFMAPEQALGRHSRVTASTDIWALGATMFTLLTGELVHEASESCEVLERAATHRARAVRTAIATVHDQFASVVDRALEFESTERWSDAGSMLAAVVQARARFSTKGVSSPRVTLTAMARAHELTDPPQATRSESVSTAHADTFELPQSASAHSPRAITSMATRTSSGVVGSTPRVRLRIFARVQRARGNARAALILTAIAGILISCFFVFRVVRRPRIATVETDGTSSKAAGAAAEEGIQLLRDGSLFTALTKLDEAAALEPSFAQAHLYYVAATGFIDSNVRRHFEAAVRYRLNLSKSDQFLLDAIEPLVDQPPREAEAARRLQTLALDPRASWLIKLFWLRHAIASAPQSERLAIAETMIATDPAGAWAWGEKAELLIDLERVDDAREAFRQCLALAPHSRGCLRSLAAVENNSGNCRTARTLSQQLIAADPGSSLGYRLLADSLTGEGGTSASISIALDSVVAKDPPYLRSDDGFRHRISLALIDGDLDRAIAAVDGWRSAVKSEPDDYVHFEIMMKEVYIAFERDRPDVAARASNEYLAMRPSLSSASGADGWPFMAHSFLYLAGGSTRATFAATRDEWLRSVDGRLADGAKWLYAFALAASTREEANEAMAAAPTVMGESLFMRNSESEQMIGHVLRLSGRSTESAVHLRRAISSCDVSNPIARVWAQVELAELLAQAKQKEPACIAAQNVADAWRSAVGSRSVRAAQKITETLDCRQLSAH